MDAINTLKEGISPGIDNIPSELNEHGGNSVVMILTVPCQKSWTSNTWPAQYTQSLVVLWSTVLLSFRNLACQLSRISEKEEARCSRYLTA